jgi:hypothetical protein
MFKLISQLLCKGHRPYLCSWYTGPDFGGILNDCWIDCVGTVRQNQRGVPDIKESKPKKREAIAAFRKKQILVMEREVESDPCEFHSQLYE